MNIEWRDFDEITPRGRCNRGACSLLEMPPMNPRRTPDEERFHAEYERLSKKGTCDPPRQQGIRTCRRGVDRHRKAQRHRGLHRRSCQHRPGWERSLGGDELSFGTRELKPKSHRSFIYLTAVDRDS